MTDAKAAYHHGDLRNALVETATELVRTSGAEGFSLRDAARTLGVSANATYRHFDSKSALLTAVASAETDKLARRMRRKMADAERALDGRDDAEVAIECFKAIGRAYVASATEEPELFRLMHGPSGLCQMRREPRADAADHPTADRILGEALDRLVSGGVIPPESRIDGEIRAWTVVHGFASLVLDGAFATVASRAEVLEGLLDFALRGLGASQAGAKGPRRQRRRP
ncbi:TetR/AcrR family transcriptional regulator [Sorangium sp. So ce119]|uniref:TetR/AcrR family transcriptional regulator n=1 Tax=Sorangium sp. So ce119 TaxID=3133279 RepID=UPI003F64800E